MTGFLKSLLVDDLNLGNYVGNHIFQVLVDTYRIVLERDFRHHRKFMKDLNILHWEDLVVSHVKDCYVWEDLVYFFKVDQPNFP